MFKPGEIVIWPITMLRKGTKRLFVMMIPGVLIGLFALSIIPAIFIVLGAYVLGALLMNAATDDLKVFLAQVSLLAVFIVGVVELVLKLLHIL